MWKVIDHENVRTLWRCPVCTRLAYYKGLLTHTPMCLGDEEGTLAGQAGPGRAHNTTVDMQFQRMELQV